MTLPPKDFICPLTKQVMTDPVQTSQGINFERDAIRKWLAFRSACPVTGVPLRAERLRSNTKLQWMIKYWQAKNKGCEEEKNEASPAPQQRFLCPLTHELMKDPVTIRGGATFEKEALLKFIAKNGAKSPFSGMPLGQPYYYENRKLQWEIKHYLEDLEHSSMEAIDPPPVRSVDVPTGSRQYHTTKEQQKSEEHVAILKPHKRMGHDMPRNSTFHPDTFPHDTDLFQLDNQDVLSILDEACSFRIEL